jgi:hypothetical protein
MFVFQPVMRIGRAKPLKYFLGETEFPGKNSTCQTVRNREMATATGAKELLILPVDCLAELRRLQIRA